MDILIISTQNPFKTSGVVAYNLFKGLNDVGYNTQLLTKYYDKFDSKDILCMETSIDVYLHKLRNNYEKILNLLGILNKKYIINPDYHIQDFDQTIQYYSTKKILKKIKFKPDVIIYLFQQNFLNAKNLYELNKLTGAKIFWYLMDTAPLTGACHYSWDCKGYISGCGQCPALYSSDENDQSSVNFNYKNRYLSKTDIEIIVATEWQKNQVLSSRLFKNKPIHKVLLSIDPNVFSFIPINQAKKKLGIPIGKKVIFFGATSINDKRKGMKYLIEALQFFKENFYKNNDNVLLLIAGRTTTLFNTLPYEVRHLGFLDNNEQLASAYQAADVFVCPSIEDAGPMMINQSIMTGTPVVSFEMGVAFDLVQSGNTGYRAKLKDSADLAKGINSILELNHQSYSQMCENCHEMGIKLCHPDLIKKQLTKVFGV